MKTLALLGLTAFAFAIEPIVAAGMGRSIFTPDFLLLPLAALVLTCPGPIAVAGGALVGLGCDALSAPSLGPQMAAFALVAAAGSCALPRNRRASIVEFVLIAFASIFAAEIVTWCTCSPHVGEELVASSATLRLAASSLATVMPIAVLSLLARSGVLRLRVLRGGALWSWENHRG